MLHDDIESMCPHCGKPFSPHLSWTIINVSHCPKKIQTKCYINIISSSLLIFNQNFIFSRNLFVTIYNPEISKSTKSALFEVSNHSFTAIESFLNTRLHLQIHHTSYCPVFAIVFIVFCPVFQVLIHGFCPVFCKAKKTRIQL